MLRDERCRRAVIDEERFLRDSVYYSLTPIANGIVLRFVATGHPPTSQATITGQSFWYRGRDDIFGNDGKANCHDEQPMSCRIDKWNDVWMESRQLRATYFGRSPHGSRSIHLL